MGSRQWKLAEDAGFGFIRYFPAGFKPNPAVAAWLLSLVDCGRGGMFSDSGSVAIFTTAAVTEILGVRAGEKSVGSGSSADEDRAWARVAKLVSVGFQKKVLTISRCRSVLIRYHDAATLTDEMEVAFIVALVIFVSSAVLSPCAASFGSKDIDPKVIMSLVEPREVGVFNWAEYTLQSLIAASSNFQKQLKERDSYSHFFVSGCYVFSLVFFIQRISKFAVSGCDVMQPLTTHFNAVKLKEAEQALIFEMALSHIGECQKAFVEGNVVKKRTISLGCFGDVDCNAGPSKNHMPDSEFIASGHADVGVGSCMIGSGPGLSQDVLFDQTPDKTYPMLVGSPGRVKVEELSGGGRDGDGPPQFDMTPAYGSNASDPILIE
ncbi:unnamed protein product [Urochloa humidicola]